MIDVNPRNAKFVLQSLKESGQPPKWGASLINVGTDRLLRQLTQEYLKDHCAPIEDLDGGGACKWIEADYGNGKTQFLRCVQENAWQENYVTAFVELSQDECPLDRPDKIFGAVARAIQATPLDIPDVDRCRGLDIALEQLIERRFPGVLTGMPDDTLRDQVIEWLNGIKSLPVESTSLLTAAVRHIVALLEGDNETVEITRLYLRGEPLPAANLKRAGIFEKLDKSNGFRMLRTVCQLVQRSGLATGVVLLFDEARRTLSLMSTKAQKVACENLLSVINRCNSGEFPGTLFLYAVMPEFFTNFATNYPALQQRCGASTRLNLNSLQGIKEADLLEKIGFKITSVFKIIHQHFDVDEDVLQHNLNVLATETIRNTGGTGTRRLMVRSCVQHLNNMLTDGVATLNQDGAQALVGGMSEELRSSERAEVEAEGE
ncbi:MAG: hypothetical protein FJ276_26360 [Planctomycetes bacterium]|nr:hypothetical protein [Planctomycetota bacterium]